VRLAELWQFANMDECQRVREYIRRVGFHVSIANRQAEIMMRIAAEFGFTPASRSRISAPLPNEPSFPDLFNQPGKSESPH
jgi:phage terminase small subunit